MSPVLILSFCNFQKDLSPLVKDLEPGNPEEEAPIPFMMAGDGVKQRHALQEK